MEAMLNAMQQQMDDIDSKRSKEDEDTIKAMLDDLHTMEKAMRAVQEQHARET